MKIIKISEYDLKCIAEDRIVQFVKNDSMSCGDIKEALMAAFIAGFKSAYTPASIQIPGFSKEDEV